jgi:hypothetical protein
MQIIRKNGTRKLSLTKTEISQLRKAASICDDIGLLDESIKPFAEQLRSLASRYDKEVEHEAGNDE